MEASSPSSGADAAAGYEALISHILLVKCARHSGFPNISTVSMQIVACWHLQGCTAGMTAELWQS
jgi:hypothetical protein